MNRDEMTKDLLQRIFKVLMYGSEIDFDTVFIDYKDMGITDE